MSNNLFQVEGLSGPVTGSRASPKAPAEAGGLRVADETVIYVTVIYS